MNLNELKLRSFRNYQEIAAQFDPGVNLIVGDNAQGKTNLLEAISYLGSGKSFRAQKTSEMVRFQEDFGEIDGSVFSQERQQSIRWILFPGSRPRQLWLNGAKKKTAGEIAGVLPTVLFCPEDLMILKMGASQRRRFGDLALCALRPNYDAALTEYNRILEQKGRILKDHLKSRYSGNSAGIQYPAVSGRRAADLLPGAVLRQSGQGRGQLPQPVFRRSGEFYPQLQDRLHGH